MKIRPKLKKWVKWILIPLFILILMGGGMIHYLVAFRFKEILQYVVNKESKGAYSFTASKITVSIWDKNLLVKNAALQSNDTSGESSHYYLVLPKVYLKIHSWKDLLFNKKMGVDSIYIATPDLKAHNVHREKEQKAANVSFQATKNYFGSGKTGHSPRSQITSS